MRNHNPKLEKIKEKTGTTPGGRKYLSTTHKLSGFVDAKGNPMKPTVTKTTEVYSKLKRGTKVSRKTTNSWPTTNVTKDERVETDKGGCRGYKRVCKGPTKPARRSK